MFAVIITGIYLSTLVFIIVLSMGIDKKKKHNALFTGFYALMFLALTLPLFPNFLLSHFPWLHLSQIWNTSYLLKQSGYIIFLLFLHYLYKGSNSALYTLAMIILIMLATFAYFLIYSIFPQLIEMVLHFYILIRLYLLRRSFDKTLSPEGMHLLTSLLLYCTALFEMGLILDILEQIPYTRPDFTLAFIDFHRIYLLCMGAVYLYWLIKSRSSTDIQNTLEKDTPNLMLKNLNISNREREVAHLILKGLTNKQIADRLFISESTVKKHINNIFRKLSIGSRWELLRLIKAKYT